MRVASIAEFVVCVHDAESDGAEEDFFVVGFEDLSHRHEVEEVFSSATGDAFYRERSIFERDGDAAIEGFVLLAPVFAVRRDGVSREDVAV